MLQPRAGRKHPDKQIVSATPSRIRNSWNRKPITKVKPSSKVYNRKRETFLDERFRGI